MLAEGNLTQSINLKSRDEIGELIESVNTVISKMNNAVGHALQVSEVLAEAASTEETSASLEEIASIIKQNAESVGQANQLMLAAKEDIQKAIRYRW